MNILVIGNGFDLAHGLPTTYGDFLKYVEAFNRLKNSQENLNSQYYSYFQLLKTSKSDIYNELDKLITNNIWLRYFINIYEKRIIEEKNGWIDFESEIATVIQALDAARLTLNEQFKTGNNRAHMEQWQLNILQPVFSDDGKIPDNRYIEFEKTAVGIKKERAINDLNRLTRCLEIYLSDYISIDNCKHLKDIAELEIDKVLSFNYTNTYKLLYDKSNSNVEYDFIHGQADISKDVNSCELVLGIDEYLSGDEKNKDNEFIQFKKFYQRIYKGTGCNYIDWLNKRNNTGKTMPKLGSTDLNIYIYGHSLDVTDADILWRLIMEKGAKTTIFYHKKESMGSQIANLVKVIGEEELIKRTDGRNRTIVFCQSSNEEA